MASSYWPSTTEMIAEASSNMISGSLNWPMYLHAVGDGRRGRTWAMARFSEFTNTWHGELKQKFIHL